MAERDISRLKIEKPESARAFKKRKRYGFWAVLAAMAVAILLLLRFFLGSATEVRAAAVSLTYPSQGLTLLNASGYVVAQRKAAVASKTTGRLVWIGVEEGSRVKTGQTIARLENEDVTAALEEAMANVVASKRNLDQAQAELSNAGVSFKRDSGLLASGIISKSEFDASEARYKKAKAAFEASRAAINATEAALKSAQVAVEYTLIRAPFDAVVLTKNADVGDIITPLGAAANAKAAVVTIADMDSLQVEADVSESNIAKVRMGQPCELELDAVPEKRFAGVVHMIVPTADRTKASVLVKIRFLEKDPRVLPEMSAKVSFLSRAVTEDEKTPRIAVDPSALLSDEGGVHAFVITDGTVRKVPVRTGEKLGGLLVVTSGLKPGERVVLSPPKRLKDGSKVTVAEK